MASPYSIRHKSLVSDSTIRLLALPRAGQSPNQSNHLRLRGIPQQFQGGRGRGVLLSNVPHRSASEHPGGCTAASPSSSVWEDIQPWHVLQRKIQDTRIRHDDDGGGCMLPRNSSSRKESFPQAKPFFCLFSLGFPWFEVTARVSAKGACSPKEMSIKCQLINPPSSGPKLAQELPYILISGLGI